MSKTTEQAEVYICDGCGKRFVILDGDMPDGFHGTAYEMGSFGERPDVTWFACKAAHIRKAVENAITYRQRDSE